MYAYAQYEQLFLYLDILHISQLQHIKLKFASWNHSQSLHGKLNLLVVKKRLLL